MLASNQFSFSTNKQLLESGEKFTVFGFLNRFTIDQNAGFTRNLSINIPLHPFAVKLINNETNGNIDASSIIDICKSNPVMMMAMLEYPLECISFASQVNSEMWRRNGNSALNMAFNYQSATIMSCYA